MLSFKKLNSSRLCVLALCLAIFLVMLLCNFKTNLVADDYRYCFSFRDGSRITHIADIFPSMSAHYEQMNGRLAAHFLVQLFLLLPLPVFKVLNSALCVLLVWLIYSLARRGGAHNALLLASIFGALWVLQPSFGQVFLWLDGSINYLWCGVLCLLWLRPWCAELLHDKPMRPSAAILYALFSLLVGAYSENAVVALVFMALLLLFLRRFYRGGRLFAPGRRWMLLSVAAMLVGFLFMMLAPGELGNKSARFSLSVLFANFLETGAYYLRFWPLLLAWPLLYVLARVHGVEPRLRILSLVLLGGSLAGHFVLTFALYCTGRSTYIALILLLAACALLLYALFDRPALRPLLCSLCAVCLGFTLYYGYVGVSDILQTNYELSFNEQLIREAAARGERDVALPRFYASTKYSALEGLPYLNLEDPTDWPNVYLAKYYGVDSVSAY